MKKWIIALTSVFILVVLTIVYLQFGRLTINGVQITRNTSWRDVIDDSDEKKIREQIRGSAEALLLNSSFEQLENMAEVYRTSKDKFSNGEWALDTFYSGLTHYLIASRQQENWEVRIERLRDWVKTNPNSVTARVALSECLVGYAFAGRGYGYANTLNEDQNKLFEERMQEAAVVLDESAEMKDRCPQWRAALLRFPGQTKEQIYQALEDAVRHNPEYSMYYFRMAIMLMPRWYGEEGELEHFCQEAADHIGGINGDILYAQILWFLDRNFDLDNLGKRNPSVDWKRVKRGIEALMG